MNKTIKLTERGIHSIIAKILSETNESLNDKVVYRCGDIVNEKDFVDVIWFSSEPIKHFGEQHSYILRINNPLIVNADGDGWSDKLWWKCCEPNGNPKVSPDDPKLTSIMPSFLWKIVQETNDEIEYGDIPYIIKKMRDKGEVSYDGVILKQISETPANNIIVDDYVVFDPKQVKLFR